MDCTQDLLDSTVYDSPYLVDSVQQDCDEDEVFFGNMSSKEVVGKNIKFNRSDTVLLWGAMEVLKFGN